MTVTFFLYSIRPPPPSTPFPTRRSSDLIASDSVSAISQAGGAWTQTVIPVGKGPEGIDLSPDGRQIWSAHSRDGGVSIIDVATKKVIETIAIGTKRSNRIKLTPDAKFALVSDLDAGEIVV